MLTRQRVFSAFRVSRYVRRMSSKARNLDGQPNELADCTSPEAGSSNQLVDREPESSQTRLVQAARQLRRETGVGTYRNVVYDGGELDGASADQPPSRMNPHKFEANCLPPVHSRSLVPFVNHSPVLRALVELGVDLFENEKLDVGRFLLQLQLPDIKEKVDWLTSIGFGVDDLGGYLSRNPYFLLQDTNNLKARVNYLESKGFGKDDIKTIVIGYRFWLNCEVTLVDSRLGWIQKKFRLNSKEVRNLVVKEPRIVMFGNGPLERVALTMRPTLDFREDQVKKILLADPRVFLVDPQMLTASHWFAVQVMKLTNDVITRHPLLLRCPVSRLRVRHEFLRSVGRTNYVASVEEAVHDENAVLLADFLAASNKTFAVKAARSYLVAYEAFLRNC